MTFATRVCALAASLAVAACGSGSASRQSEFTAPAVNAAYNKVTEGAQLVVIYYANETLYTPGLGKENYETFLRILDQGAAKPDLSDEEREFLRAMKARTERDAADFPAARTKDVADLRATLCNVPGVNLAIFTNELAVQGKWATCGDDLPFEGVRVAASDVVGRQNPLAVPANLSRALGEVEKRWKPKSSEYLLLTKAHGNEGLLSAPWLARRIDPSEADDVVRGILALRLRPRDGDVLKDPNDPDGVVKPDPNDPGNVLKDPTTNGTLALPLDEVMKPQDEKLDDAVVRLTGKGYAKVFGEHPAMMFPLVVAYSCRSRLALENALVISGTTASIPTIGRIETSNVDGLGYGELQLDAALAGAQSGAEVLQQLQDAIARLANGPK